MGFDMQSARHWARELITRAVQPGARVIDATMGNGHDTLWLAQLVGSEGNVYAFDVLADALTNTDRRLTDAGVRDRVTLFHTGHEHMAQVVLPGVDAVVFNLGWMPGTDKSVRTMASTTLAAANAALTLLRPEGLLTICVYPGHGEGREELHALTQWATSLPADRYDAMLRSYLNQPNNPPVLIAVKKRG